MKSFCERWQAQAHSMIKKEARETVKDNFNFDEIDDLIHDLKSRLQEEVDKRLDDWEKEQKEEKE